MRSAQLCPDEFLQVGRSPHLRQQPTHQLPSQHVRDPAEDRAAQLQRVLHHQHLPLVLGAGEVLVGVLEVLDDPVQRRGGELSVEPAVVEENLREEIREPPGSDEVTGQLGELPQVEPGEEAVLVEVDQRLAGHLPGDRGVTPGHRIRCQSRQ